MIVYLNCQADHGAALEKWERLSKAIAERAKKLGQELQVEELVKPEVLTGEIFKQFERGQRWFVVAGGDGSVHRLANAFMRLPAEARVQIALGAIGLGASNDFHKPLTDEALLYGVPARIDGSKATWQNVCEAVLEGPGGKSQNEFFLINASLGVLAEGNALFDRPDRILRWLTRRWMNGAMGYATVKSSLGFECFGARLVVDGVACDTSVSNLSLVINPHLKGSMKYDTPVDPQSEHFCVNLIEGLPRFGRLAALKRLSQGKFQGTPGTRSWKAVEIDLTPDREVSFELDGEMRQVSRLRVKLWRKGLKICQP